jgi:nicotinate phosphoribosyltransferase
MTDPGRSALLTDLYQLTMLDAYWQADMVQPAVFELFTRRLPAARGFLVAAGLEQTLSYLEDLAVSDTELAWLEATGLFGGAFLERLAGLSFNGDVWGLPEGSVFFHQEPVIRVQASLPEAQLVESRLMNLIHFQTMICTKAARCVLAAPGKTLVDFGMRRAHGAEAAVLAARAAWLGGFSGTATVVAGQHFGIPLYGTMAHSFVQAHESEEAAFRHFADTRPEGLVLLIDTYDVDRAVDTVARLHHRLRADGGRVVAVRLDSGDLASGARRIRQRLDGHGCPEVGIFLSGDLDEYRLRDLLGAGTPADGFGIGTRLDTSADAPSIDFAYKLQAYAGRPRRKRSPGKETWPGAKQIWREYDARGLVMRDTLRPAGHEPKPTVTGKPLLVKMMAGGQRVRPAEDLAASRQRAADELATLTPAMREPEPDQESIPEPVISAELAQLAAEADRAALG